MNRQKGMEGTKTGLHLPCLKLDFLTFLQGPQHKYFLCCLKTFFVSSTNYQSQPELVLRGLARPSLNWITRRNPLLKQILQVSLIDQLFSLMHPLPQAVVALSKFTILTFWQQMLLQRNHDEAADKKARVPDQQHQFLQRLRNNRSVQETNCFYKEKNT